MEIARKENVTLDLKGLTIKQYNGIEIALREYIAKNRGELHNEVLELYNQIINYNPKVGF